MPQEVDQDGRRRGAAVLRAVKDPMFVNFGGKGLRT